MAGKFELKKSSNDKFFFVLKAANGQTILKSQMYLSKQSAEGGIDSVRTNAPHDSRYERKPAANSQFMFNLLATNGQVVGTSEAYTTAAARDNGIDSVKTNAPTAPTIDLTTA